MTQLQDTKTVNVNGVDIAYRFDGPQDGRVLLAANSLMANGSMWDWNVPALADRYRVLRYDKRGHGKSGVTPGPYSIAQLADDAVGLLDALKPRIAKWYYLPSYLHEKDRMIVHLSAMIPEEETA